MPRKMFVNLPIKDLDASVAFFTKLGFTFDPNFTDANATCMIVNDDCAVMLLVEPFFGSFTSKDLVDTRMHTEMILAISADNREQVDQLVDTAIAAGGKPSQDPLDHGFMYNWSSKASTASCGKCCT